MCKLKRLFLVDATKSTPAISARGAQQVTCSPKQRFSFKAAVEERGEGKKKKKEKNYEVKQL